MYILYINYMNINIKIINFIKNTIKMLKLFVNYIE
jgi:hypothetical protein